ncbi:MAG: hybrid sensor histidine kinase/response regulator [Anaerolineae bacterium]|nr:hybrid sensor histidine kinase/response regulator [Anaerolineae bacterium]
MGDILIVDDEPENLLLLKLILTERGHQVRTATSGPLALETVQLQVPDLILLDILMPEMDGYEVCRRLKTDYRFHDVPVLFLSALEETKYKVQAFAAGGVDYITKPFQVDEVMVRLQTHLALRDLHRQIQAANNRLARQLKELEARNEELDAFAHTVAHDIKNPLTMIVGYADSLLADYLLMSNEDRDEALQSLKQSAVSIVNIVDELLLLTSVRRTEVTLEPLDMNYVIDRACRRLAHLIRERQAEIVAPTEWPQVVGHAPWIEEIWVNYISNGCKYGGVPPRLELGAQILADGWVQFWVHDNGDGISPEDQARLFTPYTRLGHTQDGLPLVRARGHGLGLSIVRRIVEKLGGQVGVESENMPGRGCIFSFTLPAGFELARQAMISAEPTEIAEIPGKGPENPPADSQPGISVVNPRVAN